MKKLSEFERRKAYKKAFAILDRMNQLLDEARRSHERSVERKNKKAA